MKISHMMWIILNICLTTKNWILLTLLRFCSKLFTVCVRRFLKCIFLQKQNLNCWDSQGNFPCWKWAFNVVHSKTSNIYSMLYTCWVHCDWHIWTCWAMADRMYYVKNNPSLLFNCSRKITTFESSVLWETQQAKFLIGTERSQVGIFLPPLNTNDGFYLSHIPYQPEEKIKKTNSHT